MVMARDNRIDVEALRLFVGLADGEHFPTFRAAKADFEKNYVIQALQLTNGKVAGAARLAGKDRKGFYVLMGKYRIDPDDYRK